MATNYINVKGTLAWAQVYEPDEYAGDKRWKVSFYPFDGNEWEKLRKAGVQLESREDKEGKSFVVLRRACKRLFGDDVTFFSPPHITGAVNVAYVNKGTDDLVRSHKKGDGVEIEQVGERVLLGNGTVAIANIAVYDTAKGKGHRLEALKILDLVEFNPDRVERPETQAETPKVEDKPAPAKETKARTAKAETEVKEDINDEIPW